MTFLLHDLLSGVWFDTIKFFGGSLSVFHNVGQSTIQAYHMALCSSPYGFESVLYMVSLTQQTPASYVPEA